MTLGRETTYDAIRHDAAVRVVDRDGLVVEGPGAFEWLQGQVSQDLAGLEPGGAADTLVLSPQGKIDAAARIWRRSVERFVMEVEHGSGPALEERMARFKLRVNATLAVTSLTVLECRGPNAAESRPVGSAAVTWPGLRGWDLVLEDAEMAPGIPPEGDPAAFEAVRIEAGIPVLGRELTERTIPQELGATFLERAVSFTKGCYTGQELVARLDARGSNVARRLCGVLCWGDEPEAGDVVEVDGKAAGVLTSVAWSPGFRAPVALAFAKRSVQVPASATVAGAPGAGREPLRAEIRALPLLSG